MPRLPALLPSRVPLSPAEYRAATTPRPGYWLVRYRLGAPEMPAAIEVCHHEPGNPENMLETGPILVANIGRREVDPVEVWRTRVRDAEGVAIEITKADYENFYMARLDWIRAYAPHEPEAQPTKRADYRALPPIGPHE